jgi:hypothetical protein
MLPVAAVAAQKTLPSPSLVQLGLDATAPVNVFHVPHVDPLNSFTIIADFSLSAAQATLFADSVAHDGLPRPVAVPVDLEVQLARAAGGAIKPSAKNNTMRLNQAADCV